MAKAHALEDVITELTQQLDPQLVESCAAIVQHRKTREHARMHQYGLGTRDDKGAPCMQVDKKETRVASQRRSKRILDGLGEGLGTHHVDAFCGAQQTRHVWEEPGFVAGHHLLVSFHLLS